MSTRSLFLVVNKRKAWDLNPHDNEVARFSKPARRTVFGYLPSKLNALFYLVERRGIEPRLPGCKPGVLPLDEPPNFKNHSSLESS